MNICFIILVCLYMLALGSSLAKHGEVEEKETNFWVTLIAVIINLILLYFAVKTGF